MFFFLILFTMLIFLKQPVLNEILSLRASRDVLRPQLHLKCSKAARADCPIKYNYLKYGGAYAIWK